MKKQFFDEYQMSIRNKLYYRTLIILLFTVIVNGVFSQIFGHWADALTQTIVIIYLPLGYFITFAILNDVYYSKSESKKSKDLFMYSSLLLGALNSFTTFSALTDIGIEHFIKDGWADTTIVMPLVSIYWLILGFTLLFKKLNEKKDFKEV